jgi:hypothetical protein
MPDESPDPKQGLHDEIERCRRAFEIHRESCGGSRSARMLPRGRYCPAWMVSAIQSIIATEINERVGAVGRWSVQNRQDLIDLVRADLIHSARCHGFTWEEACEFAAEFLGPTPAGHAGPAAMIKSWQRRHERGDREPERYHYFTSQLDEFQPSRTHATAIREKFVARVKQAGRYVERPPASPMMEQK